MEQMLPEAVIMNPFEFVRELGAELRDLAPLAGNVMKEVTGSNPRLTEKAQAHINIPSGESFWIGIVCLIKRTH